MSNDLEWLLEGYEFLNAQEALEIRHLQSAIEKMAGEAPYDFVDVEHLTPEQGILISDELRNMEHILRKALRRKGGNQVRQEGGV